MMDSYNIAICLAPTLIPVPEEKKDHVNSQTDAIEFIKLIIQNNNQIFPVDLHGGHIYEKFDVDCGHSDDNMESEDEDESEKQFFRSLSDDGKFGFSNRFFLGIPLGICSSTTIIDTNQNEIESCVC
jgi:hypothetical protein